MIIRTLNALFLMLAVLIVLPGWSIAQENSPTPGKSEDVAWEKVKRWFELQSATLSTRYLAVENSSGVTTVNQLQHKEEFKARFKFDTKGKYSVSLGVFSGPSFTLSWNNTGAGKGKAVTNLYLKQLYLSARPVGGVELQFGGLYIMRGESSEITSYDNDGFIVGERAIVKRPKDIFFDEVAITYAHLGDTARPNVLKRFHRLGQSNYHQFLVSKKIGNRAIVSADYTFHAGAETLRQAVKLNVRETRAIDSLRFENYQRTDVRPDYGFAISVEKSLSERLSLAGGYAQIDLHYGGLNADRFGRGKRFYVTGTYAITPELSVSAFAARALSDKVVIANRTRFDLVLSYNLLKGLHRLGAFK